MLWIPKRSIDEVNAIICGPGQMHEMETRLIDGRLQRVYKNLAPTLRQFWTSVAERCSQRTYIVFEQQRLSYQEAFERSVHIAAVFYKTYGVRKGDRVVICSRNYPNYILAFWACHLLGAVCVLVNAWLPLKPLEHCFVVSQSKLVIMDSTCATLLEHHTEKIASQAGTVAFLVWEHQEGKGQWEGMQLWSDILSAFDGDVGFVLTNEFDILPEDNATILFTSGTTGLPKGVLSTQRMFLTNVFSILVPVIRVALRRGEDLPASPVNTQSDAAQSGILVPTPLFHATGCTALMMIGTYTGSKVVLMRRWIPENIRITGGVPSMASDLLESSAVGHPLASLFFGGAPPPDWLARDFRAAFPTAILSQGYGLTETNAAVVGNAGEDYLTRPTSAGLAAPVTDFLIMRDDIVAPVGELGEIWVRGPNVMKEYYRDPAATAKALTPDGWFKTGDVGLIDHEGFLYVRDRIKDMIIRGGENIDCISVENAVLADSRLHEVAAVGVPDRRLGELVAVVASVKSRYRGQVQEREVIDIARKTLPKFAVPVMIVLQDSPLPRNPAGKTLKNELRPLAKVEWEQRHSASLGSSSDSQAKL
ncbi:acetyl-CoA synthetase-like protein [Dentipellis sp. KUC8613]|nr:acetyl-CoA synthetase-like protein [Dentipellis sp. KUC8613]